MSLHRENRGIIMKKIILSALVLFGTIFAFPVIAEPVMADVNFTGMPFFRDDGSKGFSAANPLVKSEFTTVETAGAHLVAFHEKSRQDAFRMARNAFGSGYIKVFFNKDSSVIGPISLNLTHYSRGPVKISVNGYVVEESYLIDMENWVIDDWEITPYIVDGENEIKIETLSDFVSKPSNRIWYYITNLTVLEVDASFGRNQRIE